MIIVTFSDQEEQVVEKIKAVLAEDQEIECIPIVEGKEMVFGDLEIRAKQRRVNLKGKEIGLTTREFDVLYTLACYHAPVLTTRQILRQLPEKMSWAIIMALKAVYTPLEKTWAQCYPKYPGIRISI